MLENCLLRELEGLDTQRVTDLELPSADAACSQVAGKSIHDPPELLRAVSYDLKRRHTRGDGGDDAPAPPRAAAAATAAPAATAIDDPAVLGAVARRMARFVAMGKLKRLALNVLARASVRKSTFKILPLGKGTTAPSSSS